MDPSGATIPIICFVVNIETNASHYPGMEFTLFFKNVPQITTIGILTPTALTGESVPLPYILSPPIPSSTPFAANRISPSITFKSDGNNFSVVSSGPAGWLGLPAISAILAFYSLAPPI